MRSARHFCPIVTKFQVPRQILIQVSNQISRKSVGSRAETCELTGGKIWRSVLGAFREYAKARTQGAHPWVNAWICTTPGEASLGQYESWKKSRNANSPAEVHALNICVHNRAIYFAVSCWAAQSFKNRGLFVAVLWAGKSVQITGPQQRVIFANYRIMDYYLIHVQSWFALLGFRGMHTHLTSDSFCNHF